MISKQERVPSVKTRHNIHNKSAVLTKTLRLNFLHLALWLDVI